MLSASLLNTTTTGVAACSAAAAIVAPLSAVPSRSDAQRPPIVIGARLVTRTTPENMFRHLRWNFQEVDVQTIGEAEVSGSGGIDRTTAPPQCRLQRFANATRHVTPGKPKDHVARLRRRRANRKCVPTQRIGETTDDAGFVIRGFGAGEEVQGDGARGPQQSLEVREEWLGAQRSGDGARLVEGVDDHQVVAKVARRDGRELGHKLGAVAEVHREPIRIVYEQVRGSRQRALAISDYM
eukprot:CAMPEP_0204208094 /NCGR_PEP_ID=MMETSP0361-20130328/72239_1 /ASSEMBLY_ACC=CAM_ASM_000343 /TAXON_ID=268821 /ORGANISM="Scrippsiella Hangoei, Strain SHTV-5" /LENGTH=238 /DNA_ID=CAMNT_0051171803 /DNA_START=37 /DNA_END=750 /DNA_ORIENTATION=-